MLLFLGILILATVLFNIPIEDVLQTYLNAKWYYVLAYFITSIITMLILAVKWQLITARLDQNVSFFKILQYRFASFAVQYILPTAGLSSDPIRGLLLKREGLKFKEGIASVLIDRTIEYMINVVFYGIGIVVIFYIFRYKANTAFFLILLAVILLYAVILSFINYFNGKRFLSVWLTRLKLDKVKGITKFKSSLQDTEDLMLIFYKGSKLPFIIIASLDICVWILLGLEYKFALLILGVNASALGIILVLVFVGVSHILPIPGGLGVLEVGQISASKLLNLEPSIGVALSFFVRIRDIIWTSIGIAILSYYGINIVNQKVLKKDEDN